MSVPTRQKACIPCAESKRRCDKQFPRCQRCLDRHVDCAYPQRKRRHREHPLHPAKTAQDPAFSLARNLNSTAEISIDDDSWDAIEATDLELFLSEVPDVSLLSVPGSASTYPTAPPADRSPAVSHTDAWFLRPETWELKDCTEPKELVTFIRMETFITGIKEMLHDWILTGTNGFVHQQLYEKSMPTCVQDAFTTLAAYKNRTEAVSETVLLIASERASKLVVQGSSSAEPAQDMMQQLARLHALFIYVFIQLFDGSIRARALAEQQIPILRLWWFELWETAKGYHDDFLQDYHNRPPPDATGFDHQYNITSHMWHLWILTESLRRTLLAIDAVLNIYETMTKGQAECHGGVMFTARRGLWEAESATKWCEQCFTQSPLMVPAPQPTPIIAQNSSETIDKFAIHYWKFIAGQDKIQSWIDKSAWDAANHDNAVY